MSQAEIAQNSAYSTTQKVVFSLLVLGFANGLYARVMLSVSEAGFLNAALGTFSINLIVWMAMWVVLDLSGQLTLPDFRTRDTAAILISALLAALPVSGLSWVGLSFLSLYFLFTSRENRSAYRIFSLLLTVCFCMFWSRLIFRFFMEYILRIDTILVAFLSGTSSSDNLIQAADGKTVLQVLEGCSSFTNLSLAFLGFMIARSYFGTRGLRRSILFIGLSCLAVIFINTCRIGVIAIRPDLYDLAHGAFGANIAGLLTTLAIAFISYHGAQR